MQAVVVLIVLFAAAQLVRPPRANPPIDPNRTIESQVSSELGAALNRSCGDCHSYRTTWPGYAQVAPLSWLYAMSIQKGRAAINFSEWAAYPPDRQKQLLVLACQEVSQGKMPGSAWTSLHPEAKLSTHDVEMICAASQQVEGGISK
jgi:hypothetical protein